MLGPSPERPQPIEPPTPLEFPPQQPDGPPPAPPPEYPPGQLPGDGGGTPEIPAPPGSL